VEEGVQKEHNGPSSGPPGPDFEPDGAGGRNRTADLPLTRRLLCQLSYAGPATVYRRRRRRAERGGAAAILRPWEAGDSNGPAALCAWRLLAYSWGDGIKTGSTRKAGKVLVGSGTPAGVPLIVVTMHEPTRDREEKDAVALLQWGATQ
jgi:hypothetical protein